MPTRKKTTKRKSVKKTKQRGGSLSSVLSTVHKLVKDNKLISKGLSMSPLAPLAGVASMLGYGRKKKRATKKKTKTVVSMADGVTFKVPKATRKRVIVPKAFGPTNTHYARTQVGGGIFSDLGGGIGSVFGGLGSGIGSAAHGFFGAGKRKTTKRRTKKK